jgi:AcrR family transcriptional regulator
VTWPPGCIPVAVRHGGRPRSPDPGLTLSPGDRIILLAASARDNNAHDPGHGLQGGSDCQPGLLAAQLFYNLNMCAASSDLTAMALIRQAAMRLFAERGVAEVTIREIAAEAGVSPSLVIHHFGSKGGLKAAADDRATALVDKLVSDLASGVSASSLAGVFAERFEQEPVLLTYLRRLLVDGGPAAEAMFRGLFDATVAGLGQLEAAGLVSPSADHRLRAAFLLVNDLAVVLLRDQVRAVLGIDPLSRDGMANWTAEVLQIYTRGVFTAAEPAPPAAGASGEEPS